MAALILCLVLLAGIYLLLGRNLDRYEDPTCRGCEWVDQCAAAGRDLCGKGGS